MFLIDGYNLMYAVGLASRGMTAKRFEDARLRFLDWLAESTTTLPQTVVTVFDAQQAQIASPPSTHRNIRVIFAQGQTADDRIEVLLRGEPHPREVSVVSNDSRVREDARRCGARAMTCEEFLDELLTRTTVSSIQKPQDSPERAPSEDEKAKWLAVFSTPKRREP